MLFLIYNQKYGRYPEGTVYVEYERTYKNVTLNKNYFLYTQFVAFKNIREMKLAIKYLQKMIEEMK